MTKFKRHTTEEMNNWEKTQANELAKIRASQHHLIYNLVAYVVISIIEYWLAEISKSQTLRADAFNNLSGIISTFYTSPRMSMMMISLAPGCLREIIKHTWGLTNEYNSFVGVMRQFFPLSQRSLWLRLP